MRTLKKTLALVLVLAMMFSLCAVSASADFSDADEIKYVEAVEVLSAIGIIDGMPDGSFDATGSVTRAQAAKIITLAVGGEDFADATVASFADVPADHWAADYIGYCYEEGIIAGYGDGNFGPDDSVTGYQLAKMLLVALGNDADDYTGAAWQIAVAKDASDYGIFAGNTKADKTVAATREETCLYALNAMTISVSGKVTYAVEGSVLVFTDLTTALLAAGGDVTKVSKVTPTDTLLNKNYKVSVTREADAFGRPGNQYSGKILGTYGLFFADAPVATFTGAVTEKAIFDVIGTTGVTAKFAKVFEDGTDAYWADSIEYHKTGAQAGWTAPFTGAGIATEIYVDALGNYTLVAVRDYLAKVTAVTPANPVTEAKRNITVTLQGVKPSEADDYVCYAYNTEDFAKGDYVIVNVAEIAGETYIMSIADAKTVSGTVTKATSAGVYTIAGAEYVKSQNYTGSIAVSAVPGAWYVDSYGNLIGDVSSTAIVPVHYGYLVEAAQQPYTPGSILEDGKATVEKVKFYDAKGELVTLDTAWLQTYNAAGVITGQTFLADDLFASGVSKSGILFSYKLDANGKMYDIALADWTGEANGTFEKGSAKVTGLSGIMTDKTVVFVVSNGKVTAYNGYANVPDMTGKIVAQYNASGVYSAMLVNMTGAGQTDAQYVYIKTLANTQETNVKLDGTTETVTTYTDVYVNGELVEGGMVFTNGSVSTGLYTYTTNTVTGKATLNGTNLLVGTDTVAAVASGYYTVTGYTTTPVYVDADTVYYEYNATTGVLAVAEGLPAVGATVDYNVVILHVAGSDGIDVTEDIVVFKTVAK